MDLKLLNTTYVYRNKVYTFPNELEKRFSHLTQKISHAESNPDYKELLAATTIIFTNEFNKYQL